MKSLSNISPFILLLVPVFVMILFTFTGALNHTKTANNEEAALKTTSHAPSILKISAAFTK